MKNKQKGNSLMQQETGIARVYTDEEKRLTSILVERAAKAFPSSKDKSLSMPGYDNDRTTGETLAYAVVMEICKSDHITAALKIVQDVTTVRIDDDPDRNLNMALQQIASIDPQSYLESMLICQMLQINTAITKCMGLAFMKDQTTYGKELNANLATKMQRTFVAQIEALQKLRGKGGQKVTVEHVHVHEGGQAIVGNVNHTPKGGEG